MLIRGFDPGLTVFAVIEIVIAALIVGLPIGGWRWTPLLASVVGLVVVVGNSAPIIYDLQHPEVLHPFTFMLVAVAFSFISVVGGISATVQNYRSRQRRTPRVLLPTLVGVALFLVGAVTVAAIPQNGGVGVSPDVLADLPLVKVSHHQFEQQEIRVKAGETVGLHLKNDDTVGHSFDVDELNVHVAFGAGKDGLALFKPTTPGSYTFYCAPHYNKQTGEGMKGVLIVE
jgi:plastocyanin